MAKATKTWKIGEYCRGGIITVEINGKVINVIGKVWDSSKGDNRKSDQSKAKEFTKKTITSDEHDAYWKIDCFLCDLTTSYYADKIMTWIKSKISFEKVW